MSSVSYKLTKNAYLALALIFIISCPANGKTAASGWEEDDAETLPYQVLEENKPNTDEHSDIIQEKRQDLVPLVPTLDSIQPAEINNTPAPSELVVSEPTEENNSDSIPNTQEQKKAGNWFFNPEPIPWLDSLTLKTKESAQKAAKVPGKILHQTADIASDRQFRNTTLTLAALGGAGVGLYFLLRNNNKKNNSIGTPVQWVSSYTTQNGVFVPGYWRTVSDPSLYNNFSTVGNINPYTGKPGYITP